MNFYVNVQEDYETSFCKVCQIQFSLLFFVFVFFDFHRHIYIAGINLLLQSHIHGFNKLMDYDDNLSIS